MEVKEIDGSKGNARLGEEEEMNEKSKNKREWVKTAAIIFLSVMLVLTFFSNTFMNYSLPEVATTYVQSGTITAKIRGTGVVESGDPYEIVAQESRKVMSVAVRAGDQVQKGDVLLYLEDADSEELKAAKTALETAKKELDRLQKEYDLSLLNQDVTAADIEQAKNFSVNQYRKQMDAIQKEKENAQANVDQIQAQVAQLNQVISDHDTQLKYDTTLRDSLASAPADLEAAQKAYEDAESEKNTADSSGTDEEKAAAANKLAAAKSALLAAHEANNTYTACLQRLQNVAVNKSNYELQLYGVQKNLAAAQAVVTQKQQELDKIRKTADTVSGLQAKLSAISDARKAVEKCQEEVEKQQEKAKGATVTAEISGTVSEIRVTAGKTFQYKETLVVLQPEGQGCTMSFSVTNEQARRLSVGDRADLVNAWRYDDVEVTLASIKPDKTNPGQNKELTFNITGNVVAGQTLNVSVGQKSANYDLIVPNSAIREDSNGKFILIVESKSSPLGNRYVASRVDVEVIASDDTRSAVSGALYGYEYVITTSTKPVEAGKLVRLADN